MNNLRKSALLRWKRKLDEERTKISNNRRALLMKSALCGFLAGDGSVQVRKERKEDNYHRYQLDFFADDRDMLNAYLLFVKLVYSLVPTVKIRNNMYVARTSQRVIVRDLIRLCKFGIYKWNFPENLFRIKGAKEMWLKAFFSAEGYVNKKYVKIQSVNIKSIKKVNALLSEFKIRGNYYEYSSKNKNHSKVGMIFINERKSREIYYKKIGFWHERKTEKLRQSLGL